VRSADGTADAIQRTLTSGPLFHRTKTVDRLRQEFLEIPSCPTRRIELNTLAAISVFSV